MQQRERPHASSPDDGRYRMLIEAVNDYAIYMLDPDGRVSSWNPGARRFKGYEESEILGENFSRFYTEADREQGLPRRALEIAARDGKFEGEGWRCRKDGTRFWALVVIDPIKDASGNLIGFAKITRDLTERKLAEEALRKSEEQFRLLVQGVTDYAIYMLTPAGQVSSWNAGAERIKGYRPEEIIGQHFSRFYTEEDRQAGAPRVALETAAREGRFEKEGWRIRKDGSRFVAHVIIDPIRAPDGTILGFAKITRDITERRETERALQEAREALFQSQKMDAVGQLTGGVAHDFNNLLMAVLGSLELLRKRLPADPKMTRLIDNAIQGAQRGTALTQRMLAFARRQELKPAQIDVADLVGGMTDLLHSSLGAIVQIQTDIPRGIRKVLVDPNQLELAILNLAVNARDAMPKGGSIFIAAREENVANMPSLKAGRYVCLSVTDEGCGMDEATQRRALEPFFTTKGVGKGTGLGLSMVHGMIDQSGGKLVLKSRKGEGTTVELWLPVAATGLGSVSGEEKDVREFERREGPLVILAVDDDALVLLNTVAMLEDLGHTVLEATSGKEALDIIRREGGVDLVITDQAMPHMTGSDLAAAIRAERPDLPIILATGYAELPPGTDKGLPKLSKPFRQQQLADAIVEVLAPEAPRVASFG
ncbi:hybrid sensor histidine kinase/response regulator [Bradyrhizobium erythrophlei]|uniref:histidine kinase n=1 Tax=Bradyrhizobium erythrophlei TaxID=1437360 RepID=A0A1M5JNE3_9BRAD|nr:PAS domain-containing sensor histidine kinase [Bradyrhizobium erythrophlei]SHG42106.1 PAS domain S-box-containing protein [Bradyrhizobium erythrophlei]